MVIQVATFTGHTAAVTKIILFGAHLISVDDNGCLKIWESRNGGYAVDTIISNNLACVAKPNTDV